jgi:hypothetical protein
VKSLRIVPAVLFALVLATDDQASAQSYNISTVAGVSLPPLLPAAATLVSIGYTGSGAAVDSAGNVYFVDSTISSVFLFSVGSGSIIRFAGTGYAGYSGDGGPAISAEFANPEGGAVDSSGNIYVADTYNSVVREVSIANHYDRGRKRHLWVLG